jgi:8-oxo-dGTP pyrophosphatase MutT (NUDIX family)
MLTKRNAKRTMELFLRTVQEPARFEKSIFNYLDVKDTSFVAHVNIKDRKAILSANPVGTDGLAFTAPLGRSPNCPMVKFGQWTQEQREQAMNKLNSSKRKFEYVAMAMSVLLENTRTHQVLITRRAKHMRSFPGVWVLPGGGIEEQDSDIIETAQRELLEETGVKTERPSFSPLAMWESVFPTFINQGAPTRHHLVLYMLASVDLFHDPSDVENTFETLKPQLEEVDAIAWLDKDKVAQVLEWSDRGEVLPNTEENSFIACDNEHALQKMYLSQLQVS